MSSFRAPYLQFPSRLLPLLKRHAYAVDSYEGRHKHLRASVHVDADVLRVPASVTSSTLRWPSALRDALFARLRDPVVLFVHPWEFVDFRRTPLRFDEAPAIGHIDLEILAEEVAFEEEGGHVGFRRLTGAKAGRR